MVCEECEAKLSRGACPDPWKSGSRNNNDPSGGKRIGENKALGKSYAAHRHNPYAKAACSVCKQPVSQNGGKYCQPCAYSKGVCAICGKQVLDTRFYAMGDGNFGKGRKLQDPKAYHPEGWVPPGAPAADEAAKPKKRTKAAAAPVAAVSAGAARSASGVAAQPGPTASDAWQLDSNSGYYFCVAAQAYYDPKSCMYFVGGEWLAALPGAGAAIEAERASVAPPAAASAAAPAVSLDSL